MKRRSALLTIPVLLIATSVVCPAATTFFNKVITLNSSLLSPSGGMVFYTQPFSGQTPFTVQNGDTVTGTFTFANGLAVHIQANAGVASGVFADFAANINITEKQSIQFLGLSGTLGSTNPTPFGSSSGCCYGADLFESTAVNYTFTGFTYTINVTNVSPATASFTQLSFQGTTVDFVTPEPTTLSLVGAGCGILVWMSRRRAA